MADVYQLAREQRAALIAADQSAATRLASLYRRDVLPAVERELAAINARADRLIARGEPIGPAVLYQQGRAANLLAEYESRLAGFLRSASARTEAQRREAMDIALRGAPEMLDAASPAGFTIDLAASTPSNAEAVAAMGDQVTRNLVRIAPAQAETIRGELLQHVARGRHPTELARRIRDQAGLPLTRALTIARTEQLRAHRTGSHLIYNQPEAAQVLQGWVWLSAADSRTCAACWAMHGTLHPVTEEMGSHPNCRCVQVPRTVSWRSLGFDSDAEPQMPTPGPQLFRQLPDTAKRRILGPGGFDAYRRGDITLDDLLGRTSHPVYGRGVRRVSLRSAREQATLRRSGVRVGTPAPPPAPRPAPPPAPAVPARPSWGDEVTPRGTNLRADHRAELETMREDFAALGVTPPEGFRVPVTTVPGGGDYAGAFHPWGSSTSDPSFDPGADRFGVVAIAGSQEGAVARSVMHHEYGHALDRGGYVRAGLPEPDDAASLTGERPGFLSADSTAPHWNDFRAAAVQGSPVLAGHVEWLAQNPFMAPRFRQMREYLVSPTELWARAFQQWVGEQRGIDGIGTDASRFGTVNGYWPADGWPAVREALERVMRAEGWLT